MSSLTEQAAKQLGWEPGDEVQVEVEETPDGEQKITITPKQ